MHDVSLTRTLTHSFTVVREGVSLVFDTTLNELLGQIQITDNNETHHACLQNSTRKGKQKL